MDEIKFGTDGWRAIMCDEFTFDNVRKVAQSIAEYIKSHGNENKGVIIGYDSRFMAERFAQVSAEIMTGNGIKVYLPEKDIPTPVTACAIIDKDAAGALMFTASHNPAEYNGIKFIPDYAGPAEPRITAEIEEELEEVLMSGDIHILPFNEGKDIGMVEYFDPDPDYVSRIKKIVDIDTIKNSGLKIAVDPLFGTGRGYFEKILGDAGCNMFSIHDTRDPLFGGAGPEPSESRLVELIDLVKSGEADIGLSTDGDADRFGIIDSNGAYICPNEVISLLLVHLLKNKGYKGGAARTVATTNLIDAIGKHYGIEIYESPVGFKYIGKMLREKDVIIGGEESGGLSISTHIPEKDGILACCLMAELMAVEGKSFTELLSDISSEVGKFYNKRIDISYPEKKKKSLIKGLLDNPPLINGRSVSNVSDIDGCKITYDDGSWFLVRPSGTEPLIRIYGESHSENDLNTVLDTVQSLL